MAELDQAPTSDCCSTDAQAVCCEPGDKAACCGESTAGGTCGCSAGASTGDADDIREAVRARYAAAATSIAESGSCCDSGGSLGCGNPTAVAELREGETVLDLGSGGGIDVLHSARRVGSTGKAYGLDMTDEMLDLARQNQAKAGVENVEWLRGRIEEIPLPAESVDVVISNCVINLSAEKPRVLAEAARVPRPGGRFAVADVIADEDMDEATRADMRQFTGCIAGALTRREFEDALAAAGLEQIEITETHRVHDHAGSAIVRARKPA
ncbi:MAG TPA: methyltransferase domain-containing protein [Solirubrobacterales bacterium]|jgi:SAM-dependent methyltransferase